MLPSTVRFASKPALASGSALAELMATFKSPKGEIGRGLKWWLARPSDPNAIFRLNDEDAQKLRGEVLGRVRKAVEDKFGSAYKVATFGSVRYGAASPRSDMDLVILDMTRQDGFHPQRRRPLPRIYKLAALGHTLRSAGFVNVSAIPASVPIVKFRDRQTQIDCDINVNDQPGYWNSLMLQRYTRLSPHLKGLLIALKRWAKPLGLNTPSPGVRGEILSFSSYTLALMTVGFLQSRGLLPNLQENIGPDIKERYFWNRKPVYLCDLRFKWDVPPIPLNEGISTMQLLHDWFEFWAKFDPAQDMVDIRRGGIIPRKGSQTINAEDLLRGTSSSTSQGVVVTANTWAGWEFNTICVIDPFILVRNTGRNISAQVFEKFQLECQRAASFLRTSR